jgi:lysophospholipase
MTSAWRTDDAEIATWYAADSWTLRTAVWRSAGTLGTIVFLNGRGDFIEKYSETCRFWAQSGYAVLTRDWRGQGLSRRMFDDQTHAHLSSFGPLVDDAVAMVTDSRFTDLPKPWFLVGHSMGGHLALRVLKVVTDIFTKAVLLAPMLGMNTGPVSPRLAARFVRLMVSAGQGRRFAIGQTPYGAMTRSSFRQKRLTSDVARFQQEAEAIDANPRLAVGGVTFGWVDAALRSIDELIAPGVLETITTPVLALLAGREQIVDGAAAEAIVDRLPFGQTTWIEGAAHELLRERDGIRDAVLVRIQQFLR